MVVQSHPPLGLLLGLLLVGRAAWRGVFVFYFIPYLSFFLFCEFLRGLQDCTSYPCEISRDVLLGHFAFYFHILLPTYN